MVGLFSYLVQIRRPDFIDKLDIVVHYFFFYGNDNWICKIMQNVCYLHLFSIVRLGIVSF